MGDTTDKLATLDPFTRAYLECALWASTYSPEDDPDETIPMDADYGPEDIAPEALEAMREDCRNFLEELWDTGINPAQAGHDLWLTRNHHGTGFWDRGLGEIGDRLTDASQAYGESDLHIGDDGKVHVS